MTDLHKAAQQALEAWQTATYVHPSHHKATLLAMTALHAALAQQAEPKGGGRLPPPLQAEPVAWRCACGVNLYIDAQGRPASKAEPVQEPQTLGAAMQQPRAMAQAYENGYKAGAAAEREACAKVCEGGSFLHDERQMQDSGRPAPPPSEQGATHDLPIRRNHPNQTDAG